MAGEAMMVARAMTPAHRRLRSRLTALLIATIVIDVAASGLVYVLERHAPGTGIVTIGDALFWTSTQLLTVSSQLPNPISAGARVLDVLLQAYAISGVAILAGSFGAFFHGRALDHDARGGHARGASPEEPLAARDVARDVDQGGRGRDVDQGGRGRGDGGMGRGIAGPGAMPDRRAARTSSRTSGALPSSHADSAASTRPAAIRFTRAAVT